MSNSNNLLVLGATGQVGKLVAKNLKGSGAQFSAGTRSKANLDALADKFRASRYIDLDDPRTFDEALKNVTRIFLVIGYTVRLLRTRKTLIHAPRQLEKHH